jgi:ELWxxDGT repeat protein
MSGRWSYRILGSSVARWLAAGGRRGARRPPVRPQLEVLERREMPSSTPFLVSDIRPGGLSSDTNELTNVNGTLFFRADDGSHGNELWKSDGTSGGTAMVTDINPGVPASYPYPEFLTNVNGTLFFSASDSNHGRELWKSGGTAAGTQMVRDIIPGGGGSDPLYLTNISGTLFFVADDGSHGWELWKSDGTSAGTVLVKDIDPGSQRYEGPFNLTNVTGTLFFDANDGSHGYQLWKSDGSSAGTVLVKDINPGSQRNDGPLNLTNVNGKLFFVANDGSHGTELWKSDGSSAGTQMVRDIFPGSLSSAPRDLTNISGTLFFSAFSGNGGVDLWKSDGTSAGTQLVRDYSPGNGWQNLYRLTNVNGTLFFGTDDNAVWRSDGTSAGTQLVRDFYGLGGYDSHGHNQTNVNGRLFIRADDGSHGNELWQSDGTSAGTQLVSDIFPGSNGSFPFLLTNVSGTLFFTATDGSHGRELWAFVPPPAPTLAGLSTSTAAEGSAAFTLALAGSNFDTTATVLWNGTPLTTVFQSANRLQARVPAALLAQEGSATVSVTEDRGTSGGRPFAITDARLRGLSFRNPHATEGIGFSGFTIATFADANTAAPATDFRATVTWGDGTRSAATVTSLGGGAFALVASHCYAEEGTQTLSVQILDHGGASLSGTGTIAVADARLGGLSIHNPHAASGIGTGTFTVATFTDAYTAASAKDFTATVGWGDGSTTTVSAAGGGLVAAGRGTFAVLASHTYGTAGSFTLSVQITDVGGASVSGHVGITVSAPPGAPSPFAAPSPLPRWGNATFVTDDFQLLLDLLFELSFSGNLVAP